MTLLYVLYPTTSILKHHKITGFYVPYHPRSPEYFKCEHIEVQGVGKDCTATKRLSDEIYFPYFYRFDFLQQRIFYDT